MRGGGRAWYIGVQKTYHCSQCLGHRFLWWGNWDVKIIISETNKTENCGVFTPHSPLRSKKNGFLEKQKQFMFTQGGRSTSGQNALNPQWAVFSKLRILDSRTQQPPWKRSTEKNGRVKFVVQIFFFPFCNPCFFPPGFSGKLPFWKLIGEAREKRQGLQKEKIQYH